MLPIDAPPIEGGYVAIADGESRRLAAPHPARGPVEDLGDVVLLPGLVNAHTHLEFSDLPTPLGAAGHDAAGVDSAGDRASASAAIAMRRRRSPRGWPRAWRRA